MGGGQVSTENFTRRLSAILSADVEGYSRLMREDEEATVHTLTTYRTAMTHLIQQYRGRVVDSPGDNILAEFTSVVDAVNCGVEIQRELAERNADLPENRRMRFRIGINLGDILEEGDRIYGDGVNIAARMESLAKAGETCISGTVYDAIENKIGLEYEFLGEQEVKNIDKPVRAYRVLSFPGAAAHRVLKAKRAVGRTWRNVFVAIAVVLVVGAAIAVWHFYFRPPPTEPASMEKMAFPLPDKPSIAVLPFDNMGGDPEQEFFCDGMTDQIITSLSMVPRLFVIARNSTFTYKGKAVKVQTVAEELGVRYVLEGSVQRSRERIRILVQLIDATTGRHLWSERYDRDLSDLFAVQDEIAMKIMTTLQVKLTEGEYASGIAGGTRSLKANECFWRAETHYFRISKEDNAVARRWAEKAIEHDPNFAGAWAILGWIHLNNARFLWSNSPGQSLKRAGECAQKAIALDDSCAKAYGLLGFLSGYQRQYDKSTEYGEKAVEINPNDPAILSMLAFTRVWIGHFDESRALIQKAMRLSPYYPALFLIPLSQSYFFTGQYEEGLAAARQLLERSQRGEINPMAAHSHMAINYIGLGQEDKAREHVEEMMKINPNNSLEGVRMRLAGFRDPAHSERFIAALREAGLPDNPPLPLPDKPSIAVLPFVNMSDDPKQGYFSDGITEEIITALSKTPKLLVIARNSTFTYKGKAVKVKQVGRELGVKYVLEGSVRKAGDQVRITAQLIDATTETHLWAERYDRELKDVFAIQDAITKQIITALQVKLTKGEQARMRARGTDNLEAYLKASKGLEYFFRFNEDDNARARQLAEEAIALDPNYAYGYSLLGHTHAMSVMRGWTKSPSESLEKAFDLGQKAIALDDGQETAHRLLGSVYLIRRQFDKALAKYEKATAVAPNSSFAFAGMGQILDFMGRSDEAVEALKKAFRMNPFPPLMIFP